MNPLDELPFDINSLRADSEFNWDCVDGIDQIHKDILKVYEKAILALVTPITKVTDHTLGIGTNIANYAANGIPSITTSVSNVDNTIVGNLNNTLAPLTTKYGTPGSTQLFWVVYRQLQCGNWFGVVEPWVSPPSDRTSYGPYKSECALSTALKSMMPQLTGMPVMLPFDSEVKAQIDTRYEQAVAAQGGEDDSCNPLAIWQYNKASEMVQEVQATDCGQQQPTEPTTTDQAFVPKDGTILDCESFKSRTWTNGGQIPKFIAMLGLSGTYGPYWYSPDGFYLNNQDYLDKVSLCQGTTNTNPSPVVCPPCIPAPTQESNTGTTGTATNANGTSIPDSGQTTNGTSVPSLLLNNSECCNDIANALQQIAIALGAPPANVGQPDSDVAIATGLGDDAFQLSNALVSSVDSFLGNMSRDFGISLPESSIVRIILSEMSDDQSTTFREPSFNRKE